MRPAARILAVAMSLVLTFLAAPPTARAGEAQPGGEFNSCVSSFYDSQLYNWFSVRNSCGEPLDIWMCGNSSGGCWEASNVGPGGKGGNGLSRSEVTKLGGISLYACRPGFLPVDAAGNAVSRGGLQYRCVSGSGGKKPRADASGSDTPAAGGLCAAPFTSDSDYESITTTLGLELSEKKVFESDGRFKVCPKVTNHSAHELQAEYHLYTLCQGARVDDPNFQQADLTPGATYAGDGSGCFEPCAKCVVPYGLGWEVKATDLTAQAAAEKENQAKQQAAAAALQQQAQQAPSPTPVANATPSESPAEAHAENIRAIQANLAEQEQERAEAARNFNEQNQETVTQAVVNGPHGGNEARGTGSWYFHFSIGGGFPHVPVIADHVATVSPPLSDDPPTQESVVGAGTGLGLSIDLAFWPFVRHYWGVGLAANGMVGALAGADSTWLAATATADAKAYFGPESKVAALVDVGLAWRHGSTSNSTDNLISGGGFIPDEDFQDSTTGSATYRATRLGGGVRICFSEQQNGLFCSGGLDLLALREFTPMSGSPVVFRAEFFSRQTVSLWGELGLSYPAAGQASYAIQESTGTYFTFHVGYAVDAYGD